MPQLLCESIYDFDSPNKLSNHNSKSGSEDIKREFIESRSASCDGSSSSSSSIHNNCCISHTLSSTESFQHPPPPPPPQFSKILSQRTALKIEQSVIPAKTAPPPPPLPPSFRFRAATNLPAQNEEVVLSLLPPPLPQEPTQPPPPLTADAETISEVFHDKISTSASFEIVNDESGSTFITSDEMYPQISQWSVVDAAPPIEVIMEVGIWERHTKGIGGRLLERMGYVRGLGLGKTSQGRLLPVEAVCCSGLGRGDGESDNYTVDGNALAVTEDGGKEPYEGKRSHSQSEFGDTLYSAVSTKPVGSGGFKKKKVAQNNSTAKKKNETVFDFLNKIPNSISSSIKKTEIEKSSKKKEAKKVVAKSIF